MRAKFHAWGRATCVSILMMTSGLGRAEFVQVAKSDMAQIYVDVESVTKVSARVRKAWVFDMYDREQKISGGAPYSSVVKLVHFDCAAKSLATRQGTFYAGRFRDGNPVESFVVKPKEMEWLEVIPESIAAGTLKFVCGASLK